jgi:broad specificity phosphatase PhoE
MFEYVQEREMGSRLEPRTLIYVITSGEILRDNPDKLSERGKNQIFELANSRLIAGVRKIYTSSFKGDQESAKMLGNEFGVKVDKKSCLDGFRLGIQWSEDDKLKDELSAIWNDTTFQTNHGESLSDAMERFGTCMNEICGRHRDDSIAVVSDTIVTYLFHSLVTAAPLNLNAWLSTGFASCATYEYTKTGWTLIMPPENSFLSEPTSVSDWLPDGLLD